MECTVTDSKYQKLASEYSKLRAQAGVLKKAVLDEQAKEVTLRDQLRQRESSLRRTEQEVDSLVFRNKQLESRVAALQQELVRVETVKKKDLNKRKTGNGKKESQSNNDNDGASITDGAGQEQLIFEELQRKIMENAQLASRIEDNENNLSICKYHIANLEQRLEKQAFEQNDLEQRLRKEIDALQVKNCELETKLVEAGSILGSEDALSASGSTENTPLVNCVSQNNGHSANVSNSIEERILALGKEVAHWRAQYEVAKLLASSGNSFKEAVNVSGEISDDAHCSCSTAAAGISVPTNADGKIRYSKEDQPRPPPTREQLIYNNFSKKFEELLQLKHFAETELVSYRTEVQHLQICLENSTHESESKEEQLANLNRALQLLEEDLGTTRANYEEQISVLTEEVISLSEQLANSK